MTSENIFFVIESQMYGIVCLKILLLLPLLTRSKIDLINSGPHINLNMWSTLDRHRLTVGRVRGTVAQRPRRDCPRSQVIYLW